MELPPVLPWFANKLCRLRTALFREESELVAANYSALRGAISISDCPETPPGRATGAGCWEGGQQWCLQPSVGFVGLSSGAEGTSTVSPQSLQVCPVLRASLPEVDVGLWRGFSLPGGGQGTGPAGLRRVNQVPAGPFGSPLAPLASSVGR